MLGERGRVQISAIRKLEIELHLRHLRGQGRASASVEEAHLLAIAPLIAARADEGDREREVLEWVLAMCPKLVARRGERWAHAVAKSARHYPLLSPGTLGALLGVTPELRRALGLTTIWAAGWSEADARAQRLQRRREAQAKRRREAGATPRSESMAARARAEGVDRGTLQRRMKVAREMKLAACRSFVAPNVPIGTLYTNTGHETVAADLALQVRLSCLDRFLIAFGSAREAGRDGDRGLEAAGAVTTPRWPPTPHQARPLSTMEGRP